MFTILNVIIKQRVLLPLLIACQNGNHQVTSPTTATWRLPFPRWTWRWKFTTINGCKFTTISPQIFVWWKLLDVPFQLELARVSPCPDGMFQWPYGRDRLCLAKSDVNHHHGLDFAAIYIWMVRVHIATSSNCQEKQSSRIFHRNVYVHLHSHTRTSLY